MVMNLIANGVPETTALGTLGLSVDEFQHWSRDSERRRGVRLRRELERGVDKVAAVVRQLVDATGDDDLIERVVEALRRAVSQPGLDLFFAPDEGPPERSAVVEAIGGPDVLAGDRIDEDCARPAERLEEVTTTAAEQPAAPEAIGPPNVLAGDRVDGGCARPAERLDSPPAAKEIPFRLPAEYDDHADLELNIVEDPDELSYLVGEFPIDMPLQENASGDEEDGEPLEIDAERGEPSS
jgi:hypothetical protein